MLIQSQRYSDIDLDLWKDYERADRARRADSGYLRRCAQALNELVRFTLNQPPCYVGVSWGKDSVVAAHLARCVNPSVPLIHLRPTNHNPDCDAVREAYFSMCPGQQYEEITVDYSDLPFGLCDADRDRETDSRWYASIRAAEIRFGRRHILGIRKEESAGRAIRMFRWGLSSPNACAPIGWWSTADVFTYLAIHDLPVHPAYACLGSGRWPRDRLRVAELGDTHGKGGGREQWELEYYGSELNRLDHQKGNR